MTSYNEDRAAAGLAEMLALAYGIEPETAKLIGYATALHDVGKMMIPPAHHKQARSTNPR
ncbi:MAG: hypothetical protein FWF78_08090 [Defluviitaleaceae bacterium]|nr:hypothetical protein [Defluviitaleaceae bacterium]